jgi:hypothetical protein
MIFECHVLLYNSTGIVGVLAVDEVGVVIAVAPVVKGETLLSD